MRTVSGAVCSRAAEERGRTNARRNAVWRAAARRRYTRCTRVCVGSPRSRSKNINYLPQFHERERGASPLSLTKIYEQINRNIDSPRRAASLRLLERDREETRDRVVTGFVGVLVLVGMRISFFLEERRKRE